MFKLRRVQAAMAATALALATVLYVAPDGGAVCTDTFPGTSWCVSDTADELDTDLSGISANIGTNTVPTIPTLPQGALTPINVGSDAAFNAAATDANQDITLTADLGIVGFAGGNDNIIRMNGHDIDVLFTSNGSGDDSDNILVLGPGTFGNVVHLHSGSKATDVIFAGVWVCPNCKAGSFGSSAINLSAGSDICDRWAFVNSIVRGHDTDTEAYGALVTCHEISFIECNVGAGLNSSVNDWGIRWDTTTSPSTSKRWLTDTWVRGHLKSAVRQGGLGGAGVIYSTPDCRGTSCGAVVYNRYQGNSDPAQDNGVDGIDYTHYLRLYVQYVLGDDAVDGFFLWGPDSGGAYAIDIAIMGGSEWFLESAELDSFDQTDIDALEAAAGGGEVWDLSALGGNTFTRANPIDSLVIAAPTRTTVAIDGITWPETPYAVGSDPYSAPP